MNHNILKSYKVARDSKVNVDLFHLGVGVGRGVSSLEKIWNRLTGVKDEQKYHAYFLPWTLLLDLARILSVDCRLKGQNNCRLYTAF